MPRPVRSARRWWIVGAAATVALLVGGVALVGGFADVPRQRLPVYETGERYDNGLYAITVRSIDVVDRDPLTGTELAGPAVVADVDLLFRGDRPTSGALRWLRPMDVGVTEASASGTASVRSLRNGLGEPVQPGLPIRMVYRWPLPTGTEARAGDAVRLGVYERYEVEDAPIEGVTTGSVLVGVFRTAAR